MNLKENRKIWEKRVEEYYQSKMTARQWCEKEGLKKSALSYWVTKLNKEKSVTKSQSDALAGNWLPVDVTNRENKDYETYINVKIGPSTIELKRGFDQKLLLNIVEALREL